LQVQNLLAQFNQSSFQNPHIMGGDRPVKVKLVGKQRQIRKTNPTKVTLNI